MSLWIKASAKWINVKCKWMGTTLFTQAKLFRFVIQLWGAFCPCDLKERSQNEYWTCNPENIITGKVSMHEAKQGKQDTIVLASIFRSIFLCNVHWSNHFNSPLLSDYSIASLWSHPLSLWELEASSQSWCNSAKSISYKVLQREGVSQLHATWKICSKMARINQIYGSVFSHLVCIYFSDFLCNFSPLCVLEMT